MSTVRRRYNLRHSHLDDEEHDWSSRREDVDEDDAQRPTTPALPAASGSSSSDDDQPSNGSSAPQSAPVDMRLDGMVPLSVSHEVVFASGTGVVDTSLMAPDSDSPQTPPPHDDELEEATPQHDHDHDHDHDAIHEHEHHDRHEEAARQAFAAYTNRLGQGVFRANLERVEKPRSLVFLAVLGVALACYAFWRDERGTPSDNAKQSMASVALVFLTYCALQTRDGLLIRPHPIVWRVVHGVGVLYLLLLAALVVLEDNDAKQFLSLFSTDVNKRGEGAQPHQGDASDCTIHWVTIKRQLTSMWFFAHVVGWWAKMCVYRDIKYCLILTVLFELSEVSLQHVIPEFTECWWDSIFMDTLGANLIGIGLGWATLKYLDSRHYDWVAYKPKNMRGRITRVLWQFTPFSWSEYTWDFFSTFPRFCGGIFSLFFTTMCEVNAFLLFHVLNIPAESPLNKARLVLLLLLAVPAISEFYAYMTRPHYKRIGQNTWLVVCIGLVECLLIVKFGRDRLHWTPPFDVAVCWGLFFLLLSLWCLGHFWYCRPAPVMVSQEVTRQHIHSIYWSAYLDVVLILAVLCLLPLFRRWTWQWPW